MNNVTAVVISVNIQYYKAMKYVKILYIMCVYLCSMQMGCGEIYHCYCTVPVQYQASWQDPLHWPELWKDQ